MEMICSLNINKTDKITRVVDIRINIYVKFCIEKLLDKVSELETPEQFDKTYI